MDTFVTHTLEPVYDTHSKVLILGSMPSPKSREVGFYYGHPQNRFWKVLSEVLREPFPDMIPEKKELLRKHHIALWDVLYSCTISGADDSSIKNPIPNDFSFILPQTEISAIFATGAKAAALYEKYCYPHTGIHCIKLPSTSPANCRTKFPELVKAYRIITDYLR